MVRRDTPLLVDFDDAGIVRTQLIFPGHQFLQCFKESECERKKKRPCVARLLSVTACPVLFGSGSEAVASGNLLRPFALNLYLEIESRAIR